MNLWNPQGIPKECLSGCLRNLQGIQKESVNVKKESVKVNNSSDDGAAYAAQVKRIPNRNHDNTFKATPKESQGSLSY